MSDHPTELEQLLLLAILRCGDDAWASALQEDAMQTAEREVSLGTIYVTLTRLESRGLVTSTMGDASPRRGGKARRLYRVTPEGEAVMVRMREIRDRMWAGVPDGMEPA